MTGNFSGKRCWIAEVLFAEKGKMAKQIIEKWCSRLLLLTAFFLCTIAEQVWEASNYSLVPFYSDSPKVRLDIYATLLSGDCFFVVCYFRFGLSLLGSPKGIIDNGSDLAVYYVENSSLTALCIYPGRAGTPLVALRFSFVPKNKCFLWGCYTLQLDRFEVWQLAKTR